MHIAQAQVKNIRGFREIDLDLRRPDGSLAGWTVFAGRNGSGKSTLLQAIALSVVGQLHAPSLRSDWSGWIRDGEQVGSVRTLLDRSCTDTAGPLDAYELIWRRSRSGGGNELMIPVDGRSLGPGNLISGWMLAGYGATRRLGGHGSEVRRLVQGSPAVARLVSLFREDASLIESVEWLQEVNYRKLDGKPGNEELEQRTLALLNDGLLPDGVTVDKVDSDGLWVSQGGVTLPLESLSDGYRTTAALVMDMVRHLHRAYEALEVEETTNGEGRIRVLNTGVVLIDEVELHLHVSWQQRIGFWLKEHFPNVQFLVTTHSPFICQAADPAGLIRLAPPGRERGAEHVSEEVYRTVTNGTVDDAVLSELFGLESVFSSHAERLRDDIAELEAKLQRGNATDADRERLDELRRLLPSHQASEVEQVLRRLTVGQRDLY